MNHNKYLYKSYKNEKALPLVILGSVFMIFISGGWIISIAIWVWYGFYCNKNQMAMHDTHDSLLMYKKAQRINGFNLTYAEFYRKYYDAKGNWKGGINL